MSGEIVGAFATSEPAASSDLSPSAIQTRARKVGDEWILNGTKRWISNSPVAAFIVVLAATDASGLTTFIVRPTRPACTWAHLTERSAIAAN